MEQFKPNFNVLFGPPWGKVVYGHPDGKAHRCLLRAPGTIVGLDEEVFTVKWTITVEYALWAPVVKKNLELRIEGIKYKVTGAITPIPQGGFMGRIPLEAIA